MSILSELKRRNVLRVAAAYIVSAWLIIQVAETIFPLFGYSDDPARFIVIALAIGFIPVLIVAWVFELTPDGWRKETDTDHERPAAARQTRSFDRAIVLILAIGIVYFAYDKFILSVSRDLQLVETTREQILAEARNELAENTTIAVLPFLDLSESQDQAYFADGISEEILNILANLEGLSVTARTSSFKFRNPGQDLREVGEQLGVTYILEGSVNKRGDDVRIIAQLIDANTGYHLLSQPFERKMSSLLGVTESIAVEVAGALSIALDVDGRNVLPGARTDSIEAYDLYLAANARGPSARKSQTRQQLLERALEIDPDYVDAMAMLGGWYGAVYSWQLPPEEAREAQEIGRKLVENAAEIDPTYATAYGMLSSYQWARGDWIGATQLQQKYSSMAPADIPARLGSANILGKVGRTKAALEIDEISSDLDPLNFMAASNHAEHFIQAARFDEAEDVLNEAAKLTSQDDQAIRLRQMLIAFGKDDRALIIEALKNYVVADGVRDEVNVIREVLFALEDSPAEVPGLLRQLVDTQPEMPAEAKLVVASVAAHYDDPDLALEIFGPEVRGNKVRTGRLWYPHFSEMRRLPEFKVLAEDMGFVDYWRAFEWADSCQPIGEDDFACN